ncbi:hypothetical protein ACHAWX_000975 [Stephanocyclus meneghinianus]
MIASLGFSCSRQLGPANVSLSHPAIAMLFALFLLSIIAIFENHYSLAMKTIIGVDNGKKSAPNVANDAHPADLDACFDTALWFNKHDGMSPTHVFDLMDGRAKYISISLHNQTDQSRAVNTYNATCPFMKLRYNCDGTANGREVQNWNFVLEHNEQSVCDLRRLVHHIKGPGGVAKLILSNSSKLTPQTNKEVDNPVINIFIHGNSYLRQVFESLACQWHSQITDNLLVHHGKSPTDKQNRTHKFTQDEIPKVFQYQKLIPNLLQSKNKTGKYSDNNAQCLSLTDPRSKHFLGALQPSNILIDIKHCGDDIGMIEFDNSIRFYYIFRPLVYQNIQHVYDVLGLEPENVHRIIYNDARESTLSHLNENFSPEIVRSSINFGILHSWKKLQNRDIGRWLGADNVGMVKKPDIHACMPGVPDDEANLLLFLLMHGQPFHDTNLKLLEQDTLTGPGYCWNVQWCP